MKKKLDKKTKKIAAATGMSIFSLVAVFTATIAWFYLKREVGGSGMAVKVKEDGSGLSSLKAYKCILDKSKTTDLVFDGKDEYTSTGSSQSYSYNIKIEMLDYSTLSNMSPILFLFDFTVYEKTPTLDSSSNPVLDSSGNPAYTNTPTWPIEAKDIKLSGSTTTTAVANAPAATLPLSNFVSFKSGYITHSQVGTSSSSIVRLNSQDQTKIDKIKPSSILTQNASFASYDSSGTSHETKYLFDNEIDVFSGADNDTTKVHYLAVVMDYNQDVISHWKDEYLTSFSGSRISFTCDFSLKI